MNFLAPLFLIGGLALAGPVIFHLIRRTTRERAVFSSLMFLLPTPPRLSKRSRLEHWLLLLLRCLALGLLALGFARPFFKETPQVDPSAAAPKRIAVLVDVSASMRRSALWAAARERVDAVLRRATPADEVAVFAFDRATSALVSFDEWNRTNPAERVALAAAKLAGISPGWSGTHLGNALIAAAESLADHDNKRAPGPRQVVLVSDLQTGSRLDTLQSYEWPKGVQLLVEPLKAARPTNAGVQLVAEAADAPRTANAGVRVRVTNSADAQREQFKVGWARGDGVGDFAATPVEAYVPPGQSRIVLVPVPPGAVGLDRIVLRGDDDDFDNTVFVLPPAPQRVNVLWLGSDAPDDVKQPLFFLRRALTDTPRLGIKVNAHAPALPLLPDEVAGAAVIFVADSLTPALGAALRERVLAGGTVVFAPKSADAAPTLAALLGREAVSMTEVKPDNYAMFAEIDFRHPLFAPFADPKFSDFTKIHFWRYRKLDPAALAEARVVAKFDSGDPALLEMPVGKGRLLVLASGWQPEDSQLAVSSKFVPLLYSLLEMSGAVSTESSQIVVGDVLPGASPAVQPGIVSVNKGGRERRVAVNLDPNESRTAPLSADELERLGVPVAQPAAAVGAVAPPTALLQASEAESRQKLWRWFIGAALAVLLLETLLAGWTARRLNSPTPEVTS